MGGALNFQGGKSIASKWIVQHLVDVADGRRTLLEPFIGGASVTARAAAHFEQILASDLRLDLILCWQAVLAGWVPPTEVTEHRWAELRYAEPSPERGFAAFACSFGGAWFNGYARRGSPRVKSPKGDGNYAERGSRSCLKKRDLMNQALVLLRCCDYRDWNPSPKWVVYADPPYAGVKKHLGLEPFDHGEFWLTMRTWSENGTPVLVSEYAAPPGWDCIGEKQTTASMAGGNAGTQLEKLWVWGEH